MTRAEMMALKSKTNSVNVKRVIETKCHAEMLAEKYFAAIDAAAQKHENARHEAETLVTAMLPARRAHLSGSQRGTLERVLNGHSFPAIDRLKATLKNGGPA